MFCLLSVLRAVLRLRLEVIKQIQAPFVLKTLNDTYILYFALTVSSVLYFAVTVSSYKAISTLGVCFFTCKCNQDKKPKSQNVVLQSYIMRQHWQQQAGALWEESTA